MTQVWRGDDVVAVTRIQAGPCTVTQVKTLKKDGYTAVQLGFSERKEKNIPKAQKGHLKNLGNLRFLREFRVDNPEVKRGDKIESNTFEVGDKIEVTGVSIGKGFQGVVKRHGFSGSKKTHGNKDQLRMPGSSGATGPAHVFKGMRMSGRMGGDQVTVKNLKVIEVDEVNNIISIKGALPGKRNSLVIIQGKGDLKVVAAQEEKKMEAVVEEKVEVVENKAE